MYFSIMNESKGQLLIVTCVNVKYRSINYIMSVGLLTSHSVEADQKINILQKVL